MLSLNAQDYFDSRVELRQDFLRRNIAGAFTETLIAADWASRRYFRITQASVETVILMEAIPDHTGAYTPGHKVSDFIRIAKGLRTAGIHAPQILLADEHEGFVLIEDFGNVNVYDALDSGEDYDVLYGAATDVLIRMRDNVDTGALSLPSYYDSHVHKGRQRIVDWYVPATRGEKNNDDLLPSYLAAWEEVERNAPSCPMGFVHGDFHMQNLMRLENDLGVLDFQGAMYGPLPYDIANLLEDIRRDVPEDIHDAMLARYSAGNAEFALWFRIMATQFHCRILGQVLRLAIAGGRPGFLKFIPRVQNYIVRGLQDPALAPLAKWMRDEKIDLAAERCFDPEYVRIFIRPDAF